MDLDENKFTDETPRLHGSRDSDFYISCSRMNAVLTGKRIGNALTNDKVSAQTTDDAFSLKVSAFTLRVIQNCSTVEDD